MLQNASLSALIADDHEMYRKGLIISLEALGYIKIAGEAANGNQLIQLARKLHPDLIIADVDMPGKNGVEAVNILIKELPATIFIFLSYHEEEAVLYDCFRTGTACYLTKTAGLMELDMAIQSALKGHNYFNKAKTGKVYNSFSQNQYALLTAQEYELMEYIVKDVAVAEIARRMGLQPKTVINYRQKLYTKLGVNNALGVAKWAIAKGFIKIDEL